jgi:DNA-binding response OmpR family regulator
MKIRILLVDDEKEFVETLAERLRTRGFYVATAFSGDEALE